MRGFNHPMVKGVCWIWQMLICSMLIWFQSPYGEGGLLNGRKTGICRHPNVIFLCSLTGFHNFVTIISQMKQQTQAWLSTTRKKNVLCSFPLDCKPLRHTLCPSVYIITPENRNVKFFRWLLHFLSDKSIMSWREDMTRKKFEKNSQSA